MDLEPVPATLAGLIAGTIMEGPVCVATSLMEHLIFGVCAGILYGLLHSAGGSGAALRVTTSPVIETAGRTRCLR